MITRENEIRKTDKEEEFETKKYELMWASTITRELGIGRTTLYRYIKEGKMPAPIKLGPNISRWSRTEIYFAVMRLAQQNVDAKKNKT